MASLTTRLQALAAERAPRVRERVARAGLSPDLVGRRVAPMARGGLGRAARGWQEGVMERLRADAYPRMRRGLRRLGRRRARPRWRTRLAWLGLGMLGGAALMLILDPQAGRRRRALIRDKAVRARHTVTRDIPAQTGRWARYAGGRMQGTLYRARHAVGLVRQEPPPDTDRFIADRVESEVLGDPRVPKGAININAVDGVVYVRGQVEDKDTAEYILHRVSHVEGVKEVRNLLSVAGKGA
ncbi:MAG TPA: BON domain-containing protein [Dehalococcoidia bacterium]